MKPQKKRKRIMRWVISLYLIGIGIVYVAVPFYTFPRIEEALEDFDQFLEEASALNLSSQEQDEAYHEFQNAIRSFDRLIISGPYMKISLVSTGILGLVFCISGLGLLLRKKIALKMALVVMIIGFIWNVYGSFDRERNRRAIGHEVRIIYSSAEVLFNRSFADPKLDEALKSRIKNRIIGRAVELAVFILLFSRRRTILA